MRSIHFIFLWLISVLPWAAWADDKHGIVCGTVDVSHLIEGVPEVVVSPDWSVQRARDQDFC